jgi:hypothetical protein
MKIKWCGQCRWSCNSRRSGKAEGGAYIADISGRFVRAACRNTAPSDRLSLNGPKPAVLEVDMLERGNKLDQQRK